MFEMKPPKLPGYIWINGKFVSAGSPAISAFDHGFLFGYGLFETIRADKGYPLFLPDHIERITNSSVALKMEFPRSLPWTDLISELIELNELADEVARVKIIITSGEMRRAASPPLQIPTVCILAEEYTCPSQDSYQKGWKLKTSQDGYSPPLSMHKTLNYLYFSLARQSALDAGCDESVVKDPCNFITESSTGSLLVRKNSSWFTPGTRYALPGITLKHAIRILEERGIPVAEKPFSVGDLLSAETVWVLNSMIGAMPACEIDKVKLPNTAADLAQELRKELFLRGR